MNVVIGLVYSFCLAFWIVAGLFSLHFAWHSTKYFPIPNGPMFSFKIKLLSSIAHLIWDIAFCLTFWVSVQQVIFIWKAVLAL